MAFLRGRDSQIQRRMAFYVTGSDRVRSFERLYNLIVKVAAQGNRRRLLEHFKSYFAGAAGMVSRSSDEGWADTDLQRYMEQATENAPLFIEAFYGACVSLASDDIHTPDAAMINLILAKHDAGYKIELPDLVVLREQTSIAVEVLPPSLSDQAQNIIQQSLQQSQEYLTAGQYRQAVQEILWLLETVSTLFQGLTIGTDTVEGKYFNTIADELRTHQKGTTLERPLTWAKTLHGYLSSPTGGGVRHGANLRADFSMQENEARLFCNLIRSYISFLLAEHVRFTRSN
jgi:hypothetical protein